MLMDLYNKDHLKSLLISDFVLSRNENRKFSF